MSHSSFTSPQVLDLPNGLAGRMDQVVFLDEFRIVVLPDRQGGSTELTVFNTLVPEHHPQNTRRLELPLSFHNRAAEIRVDHDRPLGTPNGDEPLIADPDQVILVMELMEGSKAHVFLVVRMQALIGPIYSTHPGSKVPWDEWGRGAVIAEVPTLGRNPCTFIHGAQMVTVREYIVRLSGKYSVQTFDFSRRGCGSLQVQGRGGGAEEIVLSQDEGRLIFELDDGTSPLDGLKLLGDGRLFYLVSCLPSHWK